jgi:hypothetical protein
MRHLARRTAGMVRARDLALRTALAVIAALLLALTRA